MDAELAEHHTMLTSLLNHSVEPGCSLGAFKSRFHVSFIHEYPSDLIKILNCLQEVAPESRLFDLQCGHPWAVFARQDRAGQQGVLQDAEH